MVVGEGQRKEQGKRTTERKGITRVWKGFFFADENVDLKSDTHRRMQLY